MTKLTKTADTWGPLYVGEHRDHGLKFQRSDDGQTWHVWITEPDGTEQHGDGYRTRQEALAAAVRGIDNNIAEGSPSSTERAARRAAALQAHVLPRGVLMRCTFILGPCVDGTMSGRRCTEDADSSGRCPRHNFKETT